MIQQVSDSKLVQNKFKFKIILITGLLAGTLDISAAIINTYVKYSRGPEAVFKFIASGAFGDAAFKGGAVIVLCGILFHYLIATSWTIIFFLVYPKLNISARYKIISGIVYGIFVWLVMNLIVMPVSNTPEISFTTSGVLIGMTFLIFFIGLPISIMYHRNLQLNNNGEV